MFTEQVGMLETLRGNGTSPQEIERLRQVLGNCEAPLAHRGPLSIMLDGTPSPPVHYDTDDEIFAALRCYNCESTYDNDTGEVAHGFAADFCGVVRIRPTLRAQNIFVENITIENIIIEELPGDTIIEDTGTPVFPQYPGETLALLGPLFIGFTVTTVVSTTLLEGTINFYSNEIPRHLGIGAPPDSYTTPSLVFPIFVGKAGHFGDIAVGDKGVAHWCQLGINDPTGLLETTNGFLVISMESGIGRGYAKATCSGTVEGTTPVTVSGFVDLGGGGLANGSVTSVANPMAYYITNGDAVRLMYNKVDAVWEIIAAAQHVEEMVESVDKSGADLRYQHKTISINRADDTTENSTWHTTTECP